jgi:hypothetical protein
LRLAALLLPALNLGLRAAEPAKPTVNGFLGLNVHTVQFKPDLYRPTARVLRNYHPLGWDLGQDTSVLPEFPFAKNRVNWESLYGTWKKEGYRTHASLVFSEVPPDRWKNRAADAAAYGEAFAKAFGCGKDLVEAVEIGNEPGKYSDAEYTEVFDAMAGAIRKTDPKLKISTCAVIDGKNNDYERSLEVFAKRTDLFDILSVHSYAQTEGWPTWRRTFPEDKASPFLESVRKVEAWRDGHAPGKEVWVTEYGWDAWSGKGERKNEFAKWETSSEEAQAAYLVRATILLMNENIQRAHIYFFNDGDEAHVHGSSGLTRNFTPKPAYWAIAQLQENLGGFSLDSLREDGEVCIATFAKGSEKRLVLWRKTADSADTRPYALPGNWTRLQSLALEKAGPAAAPEGLSLPVGPRPVYLW